MEVPENEEISFNLREIPFIEQKIITAAPYSYEEIKQIIEKTDNSVCLISKNNLRATGFLCKIPFPNTFSLLPVLFTCNHVVDQNDINKSVEIKLIFNEKNEKIIQLDNSRRNLTDEKHDITIIEIKKHDNINEKNFLEVDDLDISLFEKKIQL